MAHEWYEIYQMKDDATIRDYLFRGLEEMKYANKIPHLFDYDMIYRAKLEVSSLEHLYTKFNIDYVDDYFGRSLSVSDIICLHRDDGTIEAYFVDNVGFTELPDFADEVKDKKIVTNEALWEWSYAPRVTEKVRNYFKNNLKEYIDAEMHYILTDGWRDRKFFSSWEALVGSAKDIIYLENLSENIDVVCKNLDYFAEDVRLDVGRYQIQDTLHEFIYENSKLENTFCKITPKIERTEDNPAPQRDVVKNAQAADKVVNKDMNRTK